MPAVFDGVQEVSVLANSNGSAKFNEFSCKKTYSEAGVHQGVAFDGTYFYLFADTWILKKDQNMNLVAINNHAGADCGLNHLGDGAVYDGKIYVAAEDYASCASVSGQSIAIWNASDLSYVGKHDVSAQGHECAGLCIDAPADRIYMCSFCDGTKVWAYKLSDFSYVGAINLATVNPIEIQGITTDGTYLYISGAAQYVWRWLMDGTFVSLVFQLPGWAAGKAGEGIDIHDGLLYILYDEFVTSGVGKRIFCIEKRTDPGFTIRIVMNPKGWTWKGGGTGARIVRTSEDLVSLYWNITPQFKWKTHTSGGYYQPVASTSALPYDGIIHLDAVYESPYVKLYVDGNFINQVETDGDWMDPNWNWQVGSVGNASYAPVGEIYDVQLISRALDAVEIAEFRPAEFYRVEGTLRMWWDMEPVAGVIPDLSGHDNHGAITGPYNYTAETLSRSKR